MADGTTKRLCPLCNLSYAAPFCPEHGVPTLVAEDLDGPAKPIEMGTVIGGRYRVEQLLSQGGMGAVLLATQLGIQRTVVIKIIRSDQEALLPNLRRFYREAMASSRLSHPNIVRVHEFGVDSPTRTPYLIMEFVNGRTLRDIVDQDGPITEERALRFTVQIAKALHEAHAAEILHRDLKPRNIMVRTLIDGEELLKVLDFGLARIQSSDVPPLTAPGRTIGTPTYMSPEQVLNRGQDQRTDLYGLGCCLHMMLTGAPPFSGDDVVDTMRKHLSHPIPDLPVLSNGLAPSDGLRALHRSLLSKKKDGRPRNAGALLERLDELMQAEKPMPAWIEADTRANDRIPGIDEDSDDSLTVRAHDAIIDETVLPEQIARALSSGVTPTEPTHSTFGGKPPVDDEPSSGSLTSVLPSSLERPADSVGAPEAPTPVIFPPEMLDESDTNIISEDLPEAPKPRVVSLEVPPEAVPASRSWATPVMAVLGFVAVLSVVLAFNGSSPQQTTKRTEPTTASVPPPVIARPEPRPKVTARRTVSITTQPSGAELYVDGQLVGAAPIEVEPPGPEASKVIRARRSGYEDRVIFLKATSGKELRIQLTKSTPKRRRASSPEPAKRPAPTKAAAKAKIEVPTW